MRVCTRERERETERARARLSFSVPPHPVCVRVRARGLVGWLVGGCECAHVCTYMNSTNLGAPSARKYAESPDGLDRYDVPPYYECSRDVDSDCYACGFPKCYEQELARAQSLPAYPVAVGEVTEICEEAVMTYCGYGDSTAGPEDL